MKSPAARTIVRTIDLDHEQMLLVEDSASRIRVLYGAVWLTHAGDRRDYFARSGEELPVRTGAAPLIGSLGATRLEIHRPVVRTALARLVDALRVRARVWLARVTAIRPAGVVAGSR